MANSPATPRVDTDVVVIGGGPIGLAVACGIARAGRRVIVLEKDADTAEHSRAPAIWSRSQELLEQLGVLDAFLAEGITLDSLTLRDADRGDVVLLSIPVHELADITPHPRLLILPQSRTERLLCDAVTAMPTARVEFNAEVVDVTQDGDVVTTTFRQDGSTHVVRSAFVAGCDGARSTVRECIGAAFDGETYDTHAALADIRPHRPQELPFPRLTTRDAFTVGIRMDALTWRLIMPFTWEVSAAGDRVAEDDAKEDRAALHGAALDHRVERAAIALFPGMTGRGDYDAVWQSEFRLHRRIASRWVKGRIALAGDAAHLNSPVGGQGMNAGFEDAAALTAALVHALDDASDGEGALLEYERTRAGDIRQGVNAFTDRLTRGLLFGGGRALRPMMAAARLALRVPALRRRFLRRVAMID